MKDAANFINGEMVGAISGNTLENFAPATGKILGTIPRSNSLDLEKAIEAATNSLPAWQKTSYEHRASILRKAAALMENEISSWAELEGSDTGKPVTLAQNLDIPRAISNLRFFPEYFEAHQKETSNMKYEMGGQLSWVHRQPVGVVGLITPWNLPLYLLTWKLAPALLMGNTVVAKPSELTPLTATRLGQVLAEAGLPRGVYNVVHGLGPEIGQPLVEHPGVKAISFTGGTQTGARVAASAAPHFKKLSLELGGKNPTIIFADCDLEKTAKGVVRSGFLNQGQICLCGSRILVEESIAKQFLDEVLKELKSWTIGNPLESATRFGSLISAGHLKKVEACVALAISEGGKVVHGGRRPVMSGENSSGYFYEPTVITGLTPQSRTGQEEIFGPVVSIHTFDSEAEAIAIANGVKYGLAASVWTRDQGKAKRVAEQIQAGTVWINSWLVRDLRMPFGGMKASGVGREGGVYSLDFFSELQTISVDQNF